MIDIIAMQSDQVNSLYMRGSKVSSSLLAHQVVVGTRPFVFTKFVVDEQLSRIGVLGCLHSKSHHLEVIV
jgi:hypothetical protein